MPDGHLRIRQMTAGDLPVVDALRGAENWNQTAKDLRRFLEYEPDGCFVASIEDAVVGTVTTTAYGTDLGWIGMMLVHSDYRRRGIASALIQKSLEYLQGKGVACIKLDATPAGEPVYARLGFQAEWEFERWERAGASVPLIEAAFQERFQTPENDSRIFGANRSAWLSLLAKDSLAIQRENAFGMLRSGTRAAYLGPVIADNPKVAGEIIRELSVAIEGRVFWDVPTPNPNAVKLAKELGFRPVRNLLRMWTGQPNKGDVSRQYAIADPATG